MAFIDLLIEMRNGGVAIDAQDELDRVVEAVKRIGKKGKLQIIIDVKPVGNGPDTDMVMLQDTIKADVPKPPKKESYFFINQEGQLTTKDERQLILEPIREVMTAVQKPREVK